MVGSEPIPGASGDTIDLQSNKGPKAAAKDITKEDLQSTTNERIQAFKDLIPQLNPYGMTDSSRKDRILLLEPSGDNEVARYIMVTKDGPMVVNVTDKTRYGYRPPLGRQVIIIEGLYGPRGFDGYIVEEASQEEAMQALQRSIARVEKGIATPPYIERDTVAVPQPTLTEKVAKLLGSKKPPKTTIFKDNEEEYEKNQAERGAEKEALQALRKTYDKDALPFRLSHKRENQDVRRKTPLRALQGDEQYRIQIAHAMAELIKPLPTPAVIQTAKAA